MGAHPTPWRPSSGRSGTPVTCSFLRHGQASRAGHADGEVLDKEPASTDPLKVRLPEPTVLASAIAAITRRRTSGDESMELLPDDPLGVIRYVLMHRDVSRQVLASDVGSALVIIRCVQAQLQRDEHALVRLARDRRLLSWRKIARFQGIGTPQGAAQRFDRLQNHQAGGVKSEVAARHAREHKKMRPAWLAGNATTIEATARAIAGAGLPGEEAQRSADELTGLLGEPSPSHPDLLEWIGFALSDLQIADTLDAIPPPVRDPAVRLVSEWAELNR